MSRAISATAAAKRFREVLNDVEFGGEIFEVERHGRAVARIGPTERASSSRARWKNVLELLTSGPLPDSQLEADLDLVQQSVEELPEEPWARFSTAPS